MLYFNSDKFDFWKIYDAIKRFYPIGVKKDENGMYFSYPGITDLQNIISDNIHNTEHFRERWGNFCKQIQKLTSNESVGTTYGQAPCFSSYSLLERTVYANLNRTKEVHFFVSLIGPFYTIIGQDNNIVSLGEHENYCSTNYIVVSPKNEFSNLFHILCEEIEKQFPGYRFVPFELCQQSIEGLDVSYTSENLSTVFNAIFNNQVDLKTVNVIGDPYFKSIDWIKAGYVDTVGGWTMYPPNS